MALRSGRDDARVRGAAEQGSAHAALAPAEPHATAVLVVIVRLGLATDGEPLLPNRRVAFVLFLCRLGAPPLPYLEAEQGHGD